MEEVVEMYLPKFYKYTALYSVSLSILFYLVLYIMLSLIHIYSATDAVHCAIRNLER